MLGPGKFEKTFTTAKGSIFKLEIQTDGLLGFTMENGGVRPDIVDHRFTTIKAAEKAFERYLSDKNNTVAKKTSSEKKVISKSADAKKG